MKKKPLDIFVNCAFCGSSFQPYMREQNCCKEKKCKDKKRKQVYTDSYNRNKEKYRAIQSRWRSRNKDAVLYRTAKARAKREGRAFDIEISDIEIPEYCPVLGIKLGDKSIRYSYPSIDRINNEKGYVKGNVRVISFRANSLKSDGSLEDFEAILKYMRDNGVTAKSGEVAQTTADPEVLV